MLKRPTMAVTLAKNLRYFMENHDRLKNANLVGKAAGVAPNTVRNLLDPTKRARTGLKAVGFPTLDKLEAIAHSLNREVWELLHPDLERSIRERDMYAKIQSDYAALQAPAPQPKAKVAA